MRLNILYFVEMSASKVIRLPDLFERYQDKDPLEPKQMPIVFDATGIPNNPLSISKVFYHAYEHEFSQGRIQKAANLLIQKRIQCGREGCRYRVSSIIDLLPHTLEISDRNDEGAVAEDDSVQINIIYLNQKMRESLLNTLPMGTVAICWHDFFDEIKAKTLIENLEKYRFEIQGKQAQILPIRGWKARS